ncbi:single-stranded DNA-binding protein [Ferruginibacter yonginensis]|uniref:Single-stranded DNA-binding protein n=1 Tax=Ferruginibacter yonginensis TaxID=1310416 RepID=A0ABV8QUX3_9BACT
MVKLQIVGNLGKDCIVNNVNGKNVINFSVAHTERYKDAQGNQKEKTTWVECAYWTERTAIAPYLMKGQMVYAEGAPEAEGYTNREGNVAATLRMRVQNIQLLGGRNENQGGGGTQSQNSYANSNAGNVNNAGGTASPTYKAPSPAANMPLDDDLPF